jgi:hypothetical protein
MTTSAPWAVGTPPAPKPRRGRAVCLWLLVLAAGIPVALGLPTPVGAQERERTVCSRMQWMVDQPEAAVRQGLRELPSLMAVLGMERLWAVEHEQYEAALLARARDLTNAAILALQGGAAPIGENELGIPPHLPRSLTDLLLDELDLPGRPRTDLRAEAGPARAEAVLAALRACQEPSFP